MLLLPLSSFWAIGEPAVPDVLPHFVYRGLYLSDLALVPVLLLSVWRTPFNRRGPALLLYPLLALCVLGVVTAPFALVPGFAFYTAVRWGIALFLYYRLLQEDVQVPWLVSVFLLGLSVQVLVGMGQVVWQRPLGLPAELALPAEVRGAAIVPVGTLRWLRAYGLTFHPNVLGGYMAVGLLVCLPLLQRWGMRLVWWLLWLGLFLSFSRAAWVAVALTLPLPLWWFWRHRPDSRGGLLVSAGGAAVVLLLCALIWWPQLQTRLQPILARLPGEPAGALQETAPLEDYSLDERDNLVEIAWLLIREEPLTGVGAGHFPVAMVDRQLPARPQYVHVVPLMLAAEVGVVGGIVWLVLAAGVGVLFVRQWSRERTQNDVWGIALLAACATLMVIGLVDFYPWGLNTGRLLTVTLLGLAGRVITEQ